MGAHQSFLSMFTWNRLIHRLKFQHNLIQMRNFIQRMFWFVFIGFLSMECLFIGKGERSSIFQVLAGGYARCLMFVCCILLCWPQRKVCSPIFQKRSSGLLNSKESMLSLLSSLEVSPEMGTVCSEVSQNGPCDHMIRSLSTSPPQPAFWKTLSSNLSVFQHHQQKGSVGQQTKVPGPPQHQNWVAANSELFTTCYFLVSNVLNQNISLFPISKTFPSGCTFLRFSVNCPCCQLVPGGFHHSDMIIS